MNPKDIQRDIRSPHSRSSGQPPPLGKVARVRDTELLTDRSSTKRLRSRGSRRGAGRGNPALRKLILRWSIALGAATAAVIVAAISFWIRPYLRERDSAAAVTALDQESRVRIASRFPAPGEDEALRLVKRAMANRDPAKVAAFFHTGSASPEEVVDFFKNSESRDGVIARCSWLSSLDGDGTLLEGVQVGFKGNDKPAERLALLTPDHQGIWKMDFDAFARSVTPSWQALLEEQAESAIIRVTIGRDVYFNGPFSDDKRWTCYGMASPDIDVLLRGYCKTGSAEESAMERLLANGARTSRATLKIRRVEGADSKQFEITRVLAKDWAVVDGNLTAGDPASRDAF